MSKRLAAFAFVVLSLFATGTLVAALPDLIVSGAVTATPNPATAGNTVHVLFTILNQGTASAGPTTTRIQIKRNSDNATFADQDFYTSGVSAGQTLGENCSLVLSSSATTGSYTMYVTLDRYSAITQSSTSNDYGSGALSVTAAAPSLPDLVVNGTVSATPSPVTAGNQLTVSFGVRNAGTASAGPTTTRVQIKRNSDNATFGDQDFATSGIGAGSTLTMTCTLPVTSTATTGSYTVYVTLDRYSAITQSSTTNDYGNGPLSVNAAPQALPDLIVSGAVTTTPNPAAPGSTLRVTFSILNQGSAAAGQTTTRVQVKRNSDNTMFADQDFFTASVGAGQSLGENCSLVLSSSATAGSYTVYITLDRYTAITQSSTSNDYGNGPLTVAVAAPTISSISPTSGSTAGGDVVTIYGTNLQFASSVTFGGTAAAVHYSATTGDLQPTTPAHAAGPVSVVVTTPGGTVTLPNGFTYTASRTLTSIQVSSGPPQVNENSTAQYTCTATYSDGSTGDVTGSATWSINTTYASISGGALTTYEVPADQACQITVTYGGKTALANITIKNIAPVCTVTFNSYNVTVPAAGGSGTIQVTLSDSRCVWTPTKASDGSWLTMSPTAQQTGSGTISVSAPANPSTVNQRGTTITVGNATAAITQPASLAPTCTFSLAPSPQTMPAAGGTLFVNVTASAQTCTWTVALSAGSWASIAGGGAGTGNGTVTVSAPANPSTTTPRSTTLAVGNATATINQAASAVVCSYTLAPPTQAIPAGGGSAPFTLTASDQTCVWTATLTAGSWASIAGNASGTGSSVITVSAPTNPSSTTARSTTLTVGGATATVTQPPSPAPSCTYSLTPSPQTMPAAGGTLSFSVGASSQTCAWTATLTAGSWASIASGGTGTGNGSISVSAPSNPSTTTSRTMTLTVGNASTTITQPASQAPPPTAPTIDAFIASPTHIAPGGTSQLSWITHGAASVSISGLGVVPLTSTTTVAPMTTTTYVLTATNPTATATATATVRIDPPLVVGANVSPVSQIVPFAAALSASASGGSPPYAYHWTTGESGGNATHTFTVAGTYTVQCSVTDSNGTTRSTVPIIVTASAAASQVGLSLYDHTGTSFFGSPVTGAAADGLSVVEVRATSTRPGTITFTMSGRPLLVFDGSFLNASGTSTTSSTFAIHTHGAAGAYVASALYQVPDDYEPADFQGSMSLNRRITFSAHLAADDGGAATATSADLQLSRPPVVLIHGLWSDKTTWKDSFALINDSRFDVTRVQWDGTSGLTDAASDITTQIRSALSRSSMRGVATSRVDIVAHSMGGLIGRWISAHGNDIVHKLITMNTPHFGSEFANFCVSRRGSTFADRMSRIHCPINVGALDSLSTGDSDRMNGTNATRLRVHAIGGDTSSGEYCFTELNIVVIPLACHYYYKDYGYGSPDDCSNHIAARLLGTNNDEVVGLSSQLGGLSGAATDTESGCNAAHTRVTESRTYSDRAADLLDTPISSASFAFMPQAMRRVESASVDIPIATASDDQTLTIISPANGTTVSPGAAITIEVGGAANHQITSVAVFTMNQYASTAVGAPYATKIVIPADAYGAYPVFAVADTPEGPVSSPVIMLNVASAATLQNLVVDPVDPVAFRGNSVPILAEGFYSDGTVRPMTVRDLIIVSDDPNVVQVTERGVIATGVGRTRITLGRNGISTALTVTVLATTKPHAAAH